MLYVESLRSLDLGIRGEMNARVIEIDVSAWQERWPDAAITLMHRRSGEDTWYGPETAIVDGVLYWLVTDVDASIAGEGEAEIRAVSNDVVKKSASITTYVSASAMVDSGSDPPETVEYWLDELINTAARLDKFADEAEPAEAARQAAEELRMIAEQARIANENIRITAETARATAEIDRASAEETREKNHATMVSGYNVFVKNENIRVENEKLRRSNEETRNNNEEIRIERSRTIIADENARKQAETARATAEAERTAAEVTRGENEEERINFDNVSRGSERIRLLNENERQKNETARQQAEQERAQEFEGWRVEIENMAEIDDDTISDSTTWSSANIIYSLCPAVSASGNPVRLDGLIGGYPLAVQATVEPVQEGAGEASPGNVRPITVPNSITITSNGTFYAISLPEGFAGGTVDVTGGEVTETWGHIASYNGEEIPGDFISSTGSLTMGADVYYKLSAPTKTAISPIAILAIPGTNTITTDGQSVDVTGRQNPAYAIEALKNKPGLSEYEIYTGSYVVTPEISAQSLDTAEKLMQQDVSIQAIPYYEVDNDHGGETVIIGGGG